MTTPSRSSPAHRGLGRRSVSGGLVATRPRRCGGRRRAVRRRQPPCCRLSQRGRARPARRRRPRVPARTPRLSIGCAASLCDAITTRPAAGVLEEIERSNLFLVPLDDTRTWYRYHHLFAEMLRSELARRHPDRVAVLHRRASAWYRGRGLISEAIEHATCRGRLSARRSPDLRALARGRTMGTRGYVWQMAASVRARRAERHPELGDRRVPDGVSGGSGARFPPLARAR